MLSDLSKHAVFWKSDAARIGYLARATSRDFC